MPRRRRVLQSLSFLALCAAASWLGFRYTRGLSPQPPAEVRRLEPGMALKPVARKMAVLVFDGLRADRFLEVLEESAAAGDSVSQTLKRRGAVFLGQSGHPSYSKPMYATIGTGADPEVTGVASNDFQGRAGAVSLAQIARAAGHRVVVRSHRVPWWYQLLGVRPEERAAGIEDAARAIAQAPRAFAIVHHVDPDAQAHEGGARGEGYRRVTREVPNQIRSIVDALNLSEDVVLVTADHGHRQRGGHGGNEPEVRSVPFLLAGAGVKPGQYGEVRLHDIAPTVAVLLGLPLPPQSSGRPLLEAIDLPPDQRAAAASAWVAQQQALYRALMNGVGELPPDPESRARTPDVLRLRFEEARAGAYRQGVAFRLPVGLAAVALVLWLTWSGLVTGRAWAAALLAAGLFHGLWLMLDLPYTFSSIRTREEFMQIVFVLGTGSSLVALAAAAWRAVPGTARDAATAIVVLSFAEVVAVWTWTAFGRGSLLPGPHGIFFPLLSLGRLATVALAAAVLTALALRRARAT